MSRGIIEERQRVLDLRRGVAKKEKKKKNNNYIYIFMQEEEELRVKDRNILPFRRKKEA